MDEIIADKDVLEEDYIPLNIPCREIQKKELAFALSPAERGRRPTAKSSILQKLRKRYNEIMGKGFFSKTYSSWVEYFKEDYDKLDLTLGKGFDFPKDDLRKDFLRFIDRLCNHHITFKLNKDKIEFGIRWYLNLVISGLI